MADKTQSPNSTEQEGRAAHDAGTRYTDCPYIRGEDRWAWKHGWIAAEVEKSRREAETWKSCRVGSCQRHQHCMYSPCRNIGSVDAPKPSPPDAPALGSPADLRRWADYLGGSYDDLDVSLKSAADEIERLYRWLRYIAGGYRDARECAGEALRGNHVHPDFQG